MGLPELLVILLVAILAWILWKFYGALERISAALGEIRSVVQERLPPPGQSS